MVTLNTGSIENIVFSGISPFPAAVSGILTSIIDNNRFFMENFTGETIGTTIAERFQPALTDLSTANVLKLMAVQDLGVQKVQIGELETDNKNLMEMAKQFEDKGMFELKSLSKGIKFFKARG